VTGAKIIYPTCSAELHSAVSQIFNVQRFERSRRSAVRAIADCKLFANRRYSAECNSALQVWIGHRCAGL